MRYFLEIAYNGSRFCGWQRQPNAVSVQEVIENSLQILLQEKIETIGCGRTDAGVHASKFYLHFDTNNPKIENNIPRLNKLVGNDIAVRSIRIVEADAHARFDAEKRSYEYIITGKKDPFNQETKYYLHNANEFDIELLQKTASLFLNYRSFFPFCKTGSDNTSVDCLLYESYWKIDEQNQQYIYVVSANRFLRGMVRLLVGACLSVASGLLTYDDVKNAMDQQIRLKKSQSVPPQGLYLCEIIYPYL